MIGIGIKNAILIHFWSTLGIDQGSHEKYCRNRYYPFQCGNWLSGWLLKGQKGSKCQHWYFMKRIVCSCTIICASCLCSISAHMLKCFDPLLHSGSAKLLYHIFPIDHIDQKYSSLDRNQLNTVSYNLRRTNMFCTLPWVVKYGIGIVGKYGISHYYCLWCTIQLQWEVGKVQLR